jgi:chromosomal replication initiation ATPase DnaA
MAKISNKTFVLMLNRTISNCIFMINSAKEMKLIEQATLPSVKYINKNKSLIDPNYFIEKVNEIFNVDVTKISSNRRQKEEISIARHICRGLIKKYSKITDAEIAFMTGAINHSTIVNSRQQFNNLIQTDNKVKEIVKTIENELFNENKKN